MASFCCPGESRGRPPYHLSLSEVLSKAPARNKPTGVMTHVKSLLEAHMGHGVFVKIGHTLM